MRLASPTPLTRPLAAETRSAPLAKKAQRLAKGDKLPALALHSLVPVSLRNVVPQAL